MNQNNLLFILLCNLVFCLHGKAQQNDFNKKNYPTSAFQIKSDTSSFGALKIVVTMVHPQNEVTAKFSCRTWLTIMKNGKRLKQKSYNIEPVGGCSGVYIPRKQPCKNYFILSKFGDYEGQTLLIDIDGKLTTLKGGSFSISNDGNYLFSIFDSDVSGITVYDLKHKKIVLSAERNDDKRYSDVYFKDGKYFVSFEEETNATATSVGRIDVRQGMIYVTKIANSFLKNDAKLPVFNEVKSLQHCNCGY